MIELICVKEREHDYKNLKRLSLIRKLWKRKRGKESEWATVLNIYWIAKRFIYNKDK